MSFNPSPERFGGAGQGDLETILNGILEQMGTSFSAARGTVVWARAMSYARAIKECWDLNARMANQWDPDRMTDFLPRWESILAIAPARDATMVERRAAVKLKRQLFAKLATQGTVSDTCRTLMGSDVFVGLLHASTTQVTGSVPGGAVIPGGALLPDGPWRSPVMHLAINVTRSLDATDLDFYTSVNAANTTLDLLLPAWMNFEWGQQQACDLGEGFFLDQDNLDIAFFDE